MEMLVRWKCSCTGGGTVAPASDAVSVRCSECRGTGFIESWVPVELLRWPGKDPRLNGGAARHYAQGDQGLRWMEAFPSS